MYDIYMGIKTKSFDHLQSNTHMQSSHSLSARECFEEDNNFLSVTTQSLNILNYYTPRSYGCETSTNSSFRVMTISLKT